jgi:hypothetical protein
MAAGDTRECVVITDYTSSSDTATHQAFTGSAIPQNGEYVVLSEPNVVWNVACGVVDAQVVGMDNDVIDSAVVAADTIGASEIATDAIGNAEIASNAIGANEMAASAIGASEIATSAIGADEIADLAIDAGAIASNAIGADEIATDAIGADELAAGGIDEIWDEVAEDQGSTYSAREVLSVLLSEATGTCTYTSGTRTWVCNDPGGNETRLTIQYGTNLDGTRTSSTLAPVTP